MCKTRHQKSDSLDRAIGHMPHAAFPLHGGGGSTMEKMGRGDLIGCTGVEAMVEDIEEFDTIWGKSWKVTESLDERHHVEENDRK